MRNLWLAAVFFTAFAPATSRAGDGVAPVTTFFALEARYQKAATLEGEDRKQAVLQLAADVPIEDQVQYLFFCDPVNPNDRYPPEVLLALDVFEQRPASARPAALALLDSYNYGRPAIFKGLERVWDKTGNSVEVFLCDRLRSDCKDHLATIVALTARGTERSVPQLVDTLFFSPEKDGLTFQAQIALREIAKRDADPDTVLKPLIDNIKPGWPGIAELGRRRDVILACGGSRGKALPYLEGTLSWVDSYDFDARAYCWLSLARIGSRRALRDLVLAFNEHLVPAKHQEEERQRRENIQCAADEDKRIGLLLNAIAEIPTGRAVTNGEFVKGCGDVAGGLKPDQRAKLLGTLERLTGHKFNDDLEAVRNLGEEIEKNRTKNDTGPQDDDR